jgi:hypothetical protein
MLHLPDGWNPILNAPLIWEWLTDPVYLLTMAAALLAFGAFRQFGGFGGLPPEAGERPLFQVRTEQLLASLAPWEVKDTILHLNRVLILMLHPRSRQWALARYVFNASAHPVERWLEPHADEAAAREAFELHKPWVHERCPLLGQPQPAEARFK